MQGTSKYFFPFSSMSFCSTSCSIPLVTVHSAVHSKSDALCCTLNCQNREKAVEKVLKTKKKIKKRLSRCISSPPRHNNHQSCLTRTVKYGMSQLSLLTVTPALPHASRKLTPSLSTPLPVSLHLCTLPSPVHPRPLRSPHLTAYPGRTLGDSATGGCGRGLPLHGTA